MSVGTHELVGEIAATWKQIQRRLERRARTSNRPGSKIRRPGAGILAPRSVRVDPLLEQTRTPADTTRPGGRQAPLSRTVCASPL